MKRGLALGFGIGMFLKQASFVWAAGEDPFKFFQEEAQVVSASRFPVARPLAPATTYVVTSENIRDMGAQNIPDALRNVPGVDVIETRTGQSEVSIRGLDQPSNNRTLVLVDGKTVLNSVFDFITWESIPVTLEEIDRIEIVEGPASAIYGANAVNGVINIITKTPERLQGGQVTYTTGERNTQLGSFVYGKQEEKLGYRIGSGWHSMNQFQEASQFASQSGKFDSRLNYQFSRLSELSVSGGVTNLNTQTSVGPAGTAYEKGIVSFARTDYRYADTRVKVFWNHGRTNFNEYLFPPNTNLDYDTYDAELTQSVQLPFRNQAVIGSGYRRITARSDSLTPGLLAQDLWSAFVEDQWALAEHWSLITSGRVDRHPFTPIMFSPRGSLIYNPVAEHVFRISAGSAFRNPTLLENDLDVAVAFPNTGAPNSPITTIQTKTVGNQNLEPEKVKSVEIVHNGIFGHLKTTLTAFHYELENSIQGGGATVVGINGSTLLTQTSYINNSNVVKALGGEAALQWAANTWLSTFANYSYQYLHDDTSTQAIPNQSPRYKANTGLQAKAHGYIGNFWVNWVDKTKWPASLSPSAPSDYAPVNSYFLVNAHAGYAFSGAWNGLEISVTAFNLLNHDHYEILPALNPLLPGQNGEIVKSRWTGTVSYKF